MKRYVLGAVAFLTLAGVIGLIVQSGGPGSHPGSPSSLKALHQAPLPAAGAPTAGDVGVKVGFGSATTTTTAGSGGTGSGAAGSVGAQNVVRSPSTSLQPSELVGPRVIETAQLA